MTALRSHIIVDSSISDCVTEYTSILSSLQKTTTAQSLVTGDDIDAALFPEIAGSISALGELTDREFEPAFNLALYILSQSADPQFLGEALLALVALAPTTKPSIQDKKSLRPTTVVSAVSNVFNLLPETSSLRATALKVIISITEQTRSATLLTPLLPQLQAWLVAAGEAPASIRSIIHQVARLIETEEPARALALMQASVVDLAEASAEDVAALVTYALESSIVDLNHLGALPVVQASTNYTTLAAYNAGDLALFKATASASAKTIAKAELMAVTKFLQGKEVVSFADISQAVGVEDVELLLIKAIKQNIIQGRLNQATECFTVHQVSVLGEFGVTQWQEIQAKLQALKQTLGSVPDLVEQAKKKKGGFVTAHKKVNLRVRPEAEAEAEAEVEAKAEVEAQTQPDAEVLAAVAA